MPGVREYTQLPIILPRSRSLSYAWYLHFSALDALKQVKKGLKGLFRRKKKNEDPENPPAAEATDASAAAPASGAAKSPEAKPEGKEAPAAEGAANPRSEAPALTIVEPTVPLTDATSQTEFPAAEAQPSIKVAQPAATTDAGSSK
ncbi:unnamed protein product [Penicillium olsonii]|uniref:Uncharacterized protein n=1 Tax=Penicillium olsonii TaxID=99116 RepID=A0A9W4MWX4_PENOL|nr:unnamed protein product [Penicillium olsonii]CAG8153584.1 unnamed protein product [Penicillium olsonii]